MTCPFCRDPIDVTSTDFLKIKDTKGQIQMTMTDEESSEIKEQHRLDPETYLQKVEEGFNVFSRLNNLEEIKVQIAGEIENEVTGKRKQPTCSNDT